MLKGLRNSATCLVLCAFTAAGGGTSGCATGDGEGGEVSYSLTAKQNYEKGEAALKDENHPEAQKYFSFVKQKFPFSRYAVLAELALADLEYSRGNYLEAVDAYKSFIRLHPTHEKVEEGYAAFRIAQSYVKEMPEDWFLIPPASEKDQSAVRDAYRELSSFLERYPDTKYVEDAQKLRRQVMQRLVEHEVYVARFYLRTDHPKAAVMRIENAIRKFPDSGREGELLLTLGQTHLQIGNAQRAKQTFLRVVNEYGSDAQGRRAQLFLEYIKKRYGDDPKDATPNG